MIRWPAKAPAASESFLFDWTDGLDQGETISSAVIAYDGVNEESADDIVNAGTAVQVVLSGGTEGTVAKVTCTITTSSGRVDSEVAVLEIGGEAISLVDAKKAVRVEQDDEDQVLAGFLRAAIGHIEKATGKKLTRKVVSQTVDGFPRALPCERYALRDWPIRLLFGPVAEVLSIEYDDCEGVQQTLADFRIVPGPADTAMIVPAYGSCWPRTAHGEGTVRITYAAGYDPTTLPADLVHAALLMFGHFNANREAVVVDGRAVAVELPMGVQSLITDYCGL